MNRAIEVDNVAEQVDRTIEADNVAEQVDRAIEVDIIEVALYQGTTSVVPIMALKFL